MGIITSQKITTFYEKYKSIDVTFSKEIIQVTGLVTQQVYLKCGGDFWPCVVYSGSFEGAKVAANTQSGLIQKLQSTNNAISLRFCFQTPDKDAPLTFFVAARVSGYAPYSGSNAIALFNLQYTQRPPDDLIAVIGKVLDATVNSAKRKDERIILNADTIRRLNIIAKEAAVFIQSVPRRCMLRDISFSGAKLIMVGVAKFLEGREAALRVDFDDPRESFLIKGVFVRSEAVEGRKDLIALAVEFANPVPIGYKVRLNEYFGSRSDIKTEYTESAPVSGVDKAPPPAGLAAAAPEAKVEAEPAKPAEAKAAAEAASAPDAKASAEVVPAKPAAEAVPASAPEAKASAEVAPAKPAAGKAASKGQEPS